MAVTAKMYGLALQSLASGEINYAADTMKVMLCTSAYTVNQDTHRYKSDVTNEITGTGYTAGGVTLASKTNTYASGTNTQTLDAADVAWSGSTLTARYAVVYKDTGTAATSPLLAYVDFGVDVSTTGSTFTIVWDANGIASITAA